MQPKQPQLCVAICERKIGDLERAAVRASATGDLIELRLDCLDQQDFSSGETRLPALLKKLTVPAVITYRPAEQGGSSRADRDARFHFWAGPRRPPPPHLFDFELDIAQKFAEGNDSPPAVQVDWNRAICSHHDFNGVPANLAELYEALAATPARIVKIAVHANDTIDCLPVFQLLDRAAKEGREIIAIAMGPAGIATRVLGPSRGAFLTYAALERETGTAPGQISAAEMKQLYRIDKIDRQTQIFGLMGLPVTHSVSPFMHNAAFATTGMNAVYLPFTVRDVSTFIQRMIHPRTRELDWNFGGLSVTAPHKSSVIEQLDWIDPVAKTIGAVNTIVVRDGQLHGHNTDVPGVIKPLLQKLGELSGSRCAVIGAGGAARAALWGLGQQGAKLTVFARNPEKAILLAEKFGGAQAPLEGARFDGFDIVINTTPLGTLGEFEADTPVTAEQLRGARVAYDLVYNPVETMFLRAAKEAGCQTLGGLSMLIAQAAEQFKLWTGAEVPDGVMWEAAQQMLR